MSKPSVLFLCVHNAGRSQMAAAWMRHRAGDRVEVLSAGSNPGDRVNPAAVEVMDELGIDIRDQVPARWTEEQVANVDVIVSMGCGDECPIYPGVRRVEWELTDPAGQPVEVVRGVRDEIRGQVDSLLEELLAA